MLIVLIGPKGSGKSHVGRLLAQQFGIHFVDAELHWMEYYARCALAGVDHDIGEGAELIRAHVQETLVSAEDVCVETTGVSYVVLSAFLALRPAEQTRIVRLSAPLDLCLQRIEQRDPAVHVPVGIAQIERMHASSMELNVGDAYALAQMIAGNAAPAVARFSDLELNTETLTEAQTIAAFEAVLGQWRAAADADLRQSELAVHGPAPVR